MNPHNRQYFIIIVHHGLATVTRLAVEALLAGSRQPDKIIIIDHAQEPFELSFGPIVTVHRPAQNQGYAAGINAGIRQIAQLNAGANDIVVAMNNDVVVHAQTIHGIHEWWTHHGIVALVGVLIEEGGKLIYGGGIINSATGRAVLNTRAKQSLDYIHGAFFMAPYALFLKTHGLPEKYFMYWEDVLFSYQVRQQGLPLRVATTVRVEHRELNTARSPAQIYYLVRNGADFMEQYLPRSYRMWWRWYNYCRLYYHRWHGSKVVTRALLDAKLQHMGRMHKAFL